MAPANLNTPSQIVVSGEEAGVERLMELAEEAGAEKVVRLQVGAAFHSELMKPAQAQMAEAMADVEWSDPRCRSRRMRPASSSRTATRCARR